MQTCRLPHGQDKTVALPDLKQKLNMDCDKQAKSAVHHSFFGAPTPRGGTAAASRKGRYFVGGNKLTTDVAEEVRGRGQSFLHCTKYH